MSSSTRGFSSSSSSSSASPYIHGGGGAQDAGASEHGLSRTSTPVPGAAGLAGGSTLLRPELLSNSNPLFDCIICNRQVGSNRYAPHLAKCLGLGTKEKSSRKAGGGTGNGNGTGSGNGNGNGGGANGAAAAPEGLLGQARVIATLEARKRARAPDADLQAARDGSSGKGKSECGNLPGSTPHVLGYGRLRSRAILAIGLDRIFTEGLNAHGKRALSPGVGVGSQWKKMKTQTRESIFLITCNCLLPVPESVPLSLTQRRRETPSRGKSTG